MLDNNNNGMLPNEITTIRDILVGPQIQELTKRIEELEKILNDHAQLQNNLQKDSEAQKQELLNIFNESLEQKEQTWQQTLAETKQQIQTQQKLDKAEVGSLLVEVGRKLMNESV